MLLMYSIVYSRTRKMLINERVTDIWYELTRRAFILKPIFYSSRAVYGYRFYARLGICSSLGRISAATKCYGFARYELHVRHVNFVYVYVIFERGKYLYIIEIGRKQGKCVVIFLNFEKTSSVRRVENMNEHDFAHLSSNCWLSICM